MPVVGMKLDSMEAKRKKLPQGEIKVNSTPTITELKEIDLDTLGRKAISMTFEFVTKYETDIAEIRIAGELLYLADDNEKLLRAWKKDKKIPEKVSVEVLNHLFRRCLIKAVSLADDLQLPPPVGFPLVKTKKDVEPSYVG